MPAAACREPEFLKKPLESLPVEMLALNRHGCIHVWDDMALMASNMQKNITDNGANTDIRSIVAWR